MIRSALFTFFKILEELYYQKNKWESPFCLLQAAPSGILQHNGEQHHCHGLSKPPRDCGKAKMVQTGFPLILQACSAAPPSFLTEVERLPGTWWDLLYPFRQELRKNSQFKIPPYPGVPGYLGSCIQRLLGQLAGFRQG